jgi:hypothetical protein
MFVDRVAVELENTVDIDCADCSLRVILHCSTTPIATKEVQQ